MLTQGEDVEVHALARRGWSVSAIARHLGRDRKTVRGYLQGSAGPACGPARRLIRWRRSRGTCRPGSPPMTRISGLRRCSTRWCRWAITTRTKRPVEPRNLVRSFRRICDSNKLRTIKVHHLRQTTASLLKKLRVPARDAQTILGHSRVSTTLEIYTDVGEPPGATRSPGCMACSTSAKADSLLQAMATTGPPAILDYGVLAGGANETRTRDPLLAKSAQIAAYRS